MGAAMAVVGGAQLAGGAYSAYAGQQMGKVQNEYYQYLGDQSDTNAKLAVAEGDKQSSDIQDSAAFSDAAYRRQTAGLEGAQGAAEARNGIAGSVTAADISKDTMTKAQLDEAAIRYNADSKSQAAKLNAAGAAMNYTQQGAGYRMAGRNGITAANINATSTMLGAATQAGSSWYAGWNSRRGPGGGAGAVPSN